MNQIKYLIYASLIILAASIGYAFLHPFVTSYWIDVEKQGEFACGTANPVQPNNASFQEGKKLFQQNCQICHALDKHLTGPALRGFTERGPWSDREEVYKWIHNPSAYMKKDSYTQALQKQYGAIMVAFPQLTTEQIDAIIGYVSEPAGY